MNLTKRLMLILLCVVICVASAGCSKAGNSSGDPENIAGESLNIDDDIFPIVDEPITLTLMVTRWGNQGPYADYAFTKAYEKLTNIKIDWIECTSAEAYKVKALAFQSGDMPDAMLFITNTISDNDIHTYSKLGMFAELTDLIEEYAPNIKKLLYSRNDALATCKTEDGKIYTLPLISAEESYNTEGMWYVRQSWLDNLDLEMPKTTQDMYDMLLAFKNDDPNGNGIADEIPMAISGLGMHLWSPWGIDTWYGQNYMAINDDAEVSFFPITDSAKNALQFYRSLWNADLLSHDAFEGNAAALKKLVAQGNVGLYPGVDIVDYLSQDLCEDYVPMPFPSSGYKAEFSGNASIATKPTSSKHTILISESCKYKKELMQWLDFLWTKEGTLLRTYGPADDGYYTVNDKGEIYINDSSIDRDWSRGPSWVLGSYGQRIPEANKPESEMTWQEKYEAEYLSFDNLSSLYKSQTNKNKIGSLFFNETESASIVSLGDTYNDIYYQMRDFVTGARSIDTGWNTFVEEAIRKGVKETEDIYQQAWDRYYSK